MWKRRKEGDDVFRRLNNKTLIGISDVENEIVYTQDEVDPFVNIITKYMCEQTKNYVQFQKEMMQKKQKLGRKTMKGRKRILRKLNVDLGLDSESGEEGDDNKLYSNISANHLKKLEGWARDYVQNKHKLKTRYMEGIINKVRITNFAKDIHNHNTLIRNHNFNRWCHFGLSLFFGRIAQHTNSNRGSIPKSLLCVIFCLCYLINFRQQLLNNLVLMIPGILAIIILLYEWNNSADLLDDMFGWGRELAAFDEISNFTTTAGNYTMDQLGMRGGFGGYAGYVTSGITNAIGWFFAQVVGFIATEKAVILGAATLGLMNVRNVYSEYNLELTEKDKRKTRINIEKEKLKMHRSEIDAILTEKNPRPSSRIMLNQLDEFQTAKHEELKSMQQFALQTHQAELAKQTVEINERNATINETIAGETKKGNVMTAQMLKLQKRAETRAEMRAHIEQYPQHELNEFFQNDDTIINPGYSVEELEEKLNDLRTDVTRASQNVWQ